MSTTKQLKVYKGLPTLIKSRARGYYDDKTVLTFNTDAESQNITMDVYDGLSYDIVSSASGVKVLNFVNTVLPYKWDYSSALSTNRYCFAPVNGGSDVPIYTYNFNIIGSPTINNTTKIVGNFSGSDYLTIDGNPNFQNANSWEFVTKVTVGSTSAHQKIIHGYGLNFGVTNSGYLHLWLYNNGSWFVDSNVCSASLLSTNPFIKLSFDGTTYSCYISPDGETWTLKYSYNSTIKITPNSYTLKLANNGSEYWRGTIDLSKTSITINGDAWWIPEFTSHTEKFYYVDCYKYNNFTKVGSPTINEDTGLVSNFSTSNYLRLPQTFNPGTSDFEIVIAGIQEDNSSYVIAGTQNSTMALSLQKSCFLSTGGSTYNISLPITSTYSSGQKTWLKIVRQGNAFTRYSSLDGTTWVTESSATDSSSLNSVTLNIGFYGYETSKSYIGTVDLSETYINVDGSRFWEAKSKYTYNFSVIGSLNIDYLTSTVSGFSTSNYIQLRDAFNPGNNPWEVQVKFTTSSDVTTNQQILHSRMGTGNSGRFGIGLSFENTHFNFYCSTNGSSWSFDLYGTYTILTNTTYWVKIGWDGTEYYLEYSLDGETYTRDITNASTSGVYSPLTSSFIGVVNTGSFTNAFGGSIVFSETNIKINDSVWWEGATPYREIMPGILSNYTDDGSAVILNCFAVNGDESVVLTPDNSYGTSRLLGTVSIPAHDAYTYNNGIWTQISLSTTLHQYDRVDGKATVAGFWTDGNGQRYAVCVVDAQYRTGGQLWSTVSVDTPLPNYTSDSAALAAGESGTWSTDTILNNYTHTDYPAFNVARNACTVSVDNQTFETCLPNAAELQMVWNDRVILDTYDTTLTDYPNNSLSTWDIGGGISNSRCWISVEYNSTYSYYLLSDGSLGGNFKVTYHCGIIPVIEIPVDENGTVMAS